GLGLDLSLSDANYVQLRLWYLRIFDVVLYIFIDSGVASLDLSCGCGLVSLVKIFAFNGSCLRLGLVRVSEISASDETPEFGRLHLNMFCRALAWNLLSGSCNIRIFDGSAEY
ncbi:16450_t:CDS:2, partial [Gigaspora rosea]